MEVIESADSRKIPLANPNPDRTYKDSVFGREYIFPPLKRFLVDAKLATILIEQAKINESAAAAQASAELNQYNMLLRRGSNFAESFGSLYVVKNQDGSVEPKTKKYMFQPLVRLDEPAGSKIYLEGVAYATSHGYSVPDPAGDMIHTASEVQRANVQKPNKEWSLKQLSDYVNDNGGMAAATEPHDRLYNKACRLYRAKVKLLSDLGITVEDVEDLQEEPEQG